MSKLWVPCYGPHAGKLVSRETGEPVAHDTRHQLPPVVVPEVIATKDSEAWRRETIRRMQSQLVDAGWDATHAGNIARTGAYRADGQQRPYTDDAARRRPKDGDQ